MAASCSADSAGTGELSNEAAKAALLVLKSLTEADRAAVLRVLAGTEEVGADDAPSVLGSCITGAFICVSGAVIVRLIFLVLKELRRYHKRHADTTANFRTYLKYRFGYWYTWTEGSAGIVLLTLSLILLLVGGILLRVLADQPIPEALWAAWIWIAAPDGGGSQETPIGRMVGVFVSVGGMLIFALLMSVVSTMFEDMLGDLRAGVAPVIEGDHVVLIGTGPIVTTIVSELCSAAESRGGCVIALLCPEPKPDVEAILRESEVDFKDSTVVVRSGDGSRAEDLMKVSVDSARKVVILGRPGLSRENCDAMTLNVLLTLKNHGWPTNGTCVVQCELLRNQRLFRQLCSEAKVLTTGDFVGELMVQCSRQTGLASIVNQLFGFEGDEFYIRSVQGTAGRPFRDAMFGVSQVVPLGVASKSRGVVLMPRMDHIIQEDEELVMLAEDSSTVPHEFSENMLQNSAGSQLLARLKERTKWPEPSGGVGRPTQTVVILGWSETIGAVLVELDKSVGKRSDVVIHSPVCSQKREAFIEKAQKRRMHKFDNIVIRHSVGPLCARFQLEELPLECASKILIVSDEDADSVENADGTTMAAILQVQDILEDRVDKSKYPVILPEVNSPVTEQSCEHSGIHDKINSNLLAGRIISLVTEAPEVKGIIDGVVKDKYCQLSVRELLEYPGAKHLRLADGVSFDEAVAVAALSGEICCGWSQLGGTALGPWEFNPKDRKARRPWQQDSRLVVLRQHC